MAFFVSENWTMRHRLLLTIGAILAVCQLISVFWLWHESQEQIQLLVASAIEGHNNQKHIEHEVREAVASLLIPSLLIIGLALYISLLAVKKITKPLSRLQLELESRTPDNLQPITLKESVPEVTAVTTAINQLVSRLNLTLDRERLFTADVAHELRTPLAGLRLHLELLAKVHGVSVDPLIQRLDQMTNSITQLLQLARVGQSFSAGSYQQVALKEDVIEPLQSELETMLQQRQQTLAINVKDGEAIVSGDATLVQVAQLLQRTLRSTDFVARTVGEEFLVLLPETDAEGGLQSDAESRMRLRSIDVQLLRVLEELSAGRQESTADIRADLSMLTAALRQLSRGTVGRG